MDRGRARIKRARVGANHTLAEVSRLEPLVAEKRLHVLDHRPLEMQLSGLDIAFESRLNYLTGRRGADPEVAAVRGAEGVTKPALHVAETSKAGKIRGGKPTQFGLTAVAVVPQLDAGAIVERDEHPRTGGHPGQSPRDQPELFDHQRVEQADE